MKVSISVEQNKRTSWTVRIHEGEGEGYGQPTIAYITAEPYGYELCRMKGISGKLPMTTRLQLRDWLISLGFTRVRWERLDEVGKEPTIHEYSLLRYTKRRNESDGEVLPVSVSDYAYVI